MDEKKLPVDGDEQELNHEQDLSGLSQAEITAMEQGWKPLSEWEGEEDDWVTAPEFNRRGELMDRIKAQSKTLSRTQHKVEELGQALRTVMNNREKELQQERDRVLRELRNEKVDALRVGDAEAIVEIDDRINELRASALTQEVSAPPQRRQAPREVVEWTQNTEWYRNNSAMRGAADAVAFEYAKANPDSIQDPMQILQHVEREIKKAFPSHFTRKAPAGPGDTNSTVSPKGSSKRITARSLSEEQARIARTMVSAGAIKDVDEYARQLHHLGEL